MSALAAGVNKKRKKSETKPQAQINKCNNEKRRREQENIYIEELAELISANFADMSSLSVKPDKCAILQETVHQIRSIKQRESAEQSTDPVQQGEVSSSRPTILSNEVYGPLLLEALEGFLFVVSAEGKVEHVTDNVATYIKFTRDEVLGKSIYNFIHHGDHARFSACLLPMSIGWGNEQPPRSRSFSIRFLVKALEEQDETVEEKQQRVSCYELMQISSTLLRDQVSVSEEDGSDSGPCLLCVASRISHRDKAASNIEQFTTKLDTTGRIIGVDTSSVSAVYSQYINKDLVDQVLRDLVPQQDLHKLNAHLRETLSAGQSTSAVYRLQVGPDKLVQVQTKSKLFKTTDSNDTDFIMATHSIIGENDAIGPSDPGGGTLNNNTNNNNNNGGVGGPLMTSIVNGTRNGAPVSSGSESSTTSSNHALLNTNTASFTSFNLENEFNFDIFPSSTWDQLDGSTWETTRPDSRQSATPVSTPTPRPSSNPAFSPATTVAQSPLTGQFVTQPSPNLPNPSTPVPYGSTFPFSPLPEQTFSLEEQKDTKANVMEEASAMMADSVKLRNLLTKPPNSVDSGSDNDNRNRNKILKGLLNQQDEDDNRSDNRNSPRGLMGRGPMQGSTSELPNKSSTSTSSSGGNNMLRQLLNDTSDEDDLEAKAGMKKKSELLQQLLKSETKDESEEKRNELPSSEDSLLRSLGFSGSPSPPGGDGNRNRKRPSDERDDGPSKRMSDGSQVSSSESTPGTSKLWEKNKMLASLLAKQPNTNQPIPPVPASVISAIPQEKLPRPTDPNLNRNRMMNQNAQLQQQQHQQQQQQQQQLLNNARITNRAPIRAQTNYLNNILTSPNPMQRTESHQIQNSTICYTSATTSSTETSLWSNSSNASNSVGDPVLSDILDQVIDIAPAPDKIATIYSGVNEKVAIHHIQRALMMQCESGYPPLPAMTASTGLPTTPPAYSMAMTTQNAGNYPPPPNYPQMNFNMKPRTQTAQLVHPYGTSLSQQQLLQQHQKKMMLQQQQEQKRRLLSAQQHQHLVVNTKTATEINSGLQAMDSLLNNTVAPNVTVKRTTGVPESQLSPGYSGQLAQADRRVTVSAQQPFSPHAQLTSPIGQQSAFPQTTINNYQQAPARLSPQAVYNQQLSPRQTFQQGNSQPQNWQQAQARLSVQNPMLNAQLTGTYISGGVNGRNFQRAPPQQAQRQMSSPGTVQAQPQQFLTDQFADPTSPNSAYNQNQYLRLQRTNSAPTATTQLPGGLGSPRPYGREHHPQQPPPQHPYPTIPPPHHPMMYQQDSSQYCYDQTGLQLAYNGADRGRAPPHLQPGVSATGGPTSEYVRQELRAVVGARTAQAQPPPPPPPQSRTPSQILSQQTVADLDSLGLSFEMPTPGASESPKLWGAMGSDMGSLSPQPATSRSTMEEPRGGDHKASLLQKLLSE